MKKILSRIFSVALIAATVATPSFAQLAKKAGGNNPSNATVTMKAQAAPQKSAKKSKSLLELTKTRKAGVAGFRTAKKASNVVKRSQTIFKAEGDVPQINASMLYYDGMTNAEVGVYTMPTSASVERELIVAGPQASYGGCVIDGIYYCGVLEDIMGFFQYYKAEGWDLESGEKVYSFDGNPDVLALGMAADPLTGKVIGIYYNADATACNLCLAEYPTSGEAAPTFTVIGQVTGGPQVYNAMGVTASGEVYAIGNDGSLYKIDRSTAVATLVGATGFVPEYLSGAVIDTKTDKMYWTVNPVDETGLLVEVNLSTGAGTLIYQFPDNAEYAGLYIPAPAAEPTAPAECKNVNFHFEEDSLEGNVTLTTPATLFDGTTQGSGELFVMVLANGQMVAGGEPQPWNTQITIPVDLSLMGPGMYDFVVFAAGDGGEGPKTKVKNVWVGADTPEATKATLTYANGNMEVSWLPVTASVNGGYLDLDNLTYTVKNHEGAVVAQGLTTTTFTEAVAEPENITSYFYTVEVVCGDLVSAAAQTNTVVLGSIVPPYMSDFSNASGLEGWTIIDANEDGKVWTINDNAVRMGYNSSKDMDDWLITPPVKLEAGKAYNLAFQAKSNGTAFPERIEVKYGKANTAEGMTNTVIPATDLTTGEWVDFDNMIAPEEDGVYYIGFHGISDADMFYLWVRDIQIEAGISALAPGLASNLTATPDASGALKCTVAFNAPDKTMNNQTLSDLTKVEVLRGETVVKTFNAPAVGSALSFEDVLTEGGDVTYTVIGYNAEGAGLKASVSTFVGFDVPAALASATIARTAVEGEVTVSWSPVTEDVNGLPFPAGEVTYAVCAQEGNQWVPFAQGLTGTSYTYQAVAAGEQDFIQVAVFPFSSAGNGMGMATEMIPVGTPYNGISESFANGTLSYIWGLSAIGNGNVSIFTDDKFTDMASQDGDNGYLAIQAQYLDEGANLFTGLISLNQIENPGLVFYTNNIDGDSPDINEITVSVKEADQEEWTVVMGPKTVDELCGGAAGWGRVSVSLGAYANKVIQVQLTAVTKQYVYTMFDNISVGSILAHDVAAASISAPGKVKCGEDYTVNVKVVNEGAQKAEGVSVELYADEDLVETKQVASLEAGASETVSFERTMSALATENVELFAKVVYAADMNADNNQTSSVTVVPVVSNLPTATNLEAENTVAGVKLTWDEPNLAGGVAEQVTDDFEDADSFAAEYGDWTFVDVDASPVGGFQGSDIPGITPGSTTGSFWIFDNTADTWNQTFDAYSGNKYLFSLFRYDDGQADDWAISPELTGDAQTISFYARSYSSQYPEKISVYYSTGSLNPEDFQLIDGTTVNAVPGEWTEYTVDLPAGAKHFAIRSWASGSFMLMVDDVTYTPAGVTANIEIAGYNVYRDGVKINSELVQETEYVDANVTVDEQYTYVVTVVYTDKGESPASNETVIRVVGVESIVDGAVSISAVGNNIVILNAIDQNVSVVAANGAVVFNGLGEAKTTVSVASGVYVVKAGNTVRKLVVK